MDNNQNNIQLALKFNDEYSGKTRIDHTTDLIHNPEKLCPQPELTTSLCANRDNQNEFFSKLCLEIDKQPYSVKATCTYDILHMPFIPLLALSTHMILFLGLKYPNIECEASTVEGRDGTWNMNMMTFKKPATISSFAVIDCCGRGKDTFFCGS